MHISRRDTPSSITACISWLKVHLRPREDCHSSLLRTQCASHLSFDGPGFFLVAVLFGLIDTVPSSSPHWPSALAGFSSDPSTSSSLPGPLQPFSPGLSSLSPRQHAGWKLRPCRTDVVTEAGDRVEALLTPSWPGGCSHVNKHGERASGVIRPGGQFFPQIRTGASVGRLGRCAFWQI